MVFTTVPAPLANWRYHRHAAVELRVLIPHLQTLVERDQLGDPDAEPHLGLNLQRPIDDRFFQVERPSRNVEFVGDALVDLILAHHSQDRLLAGRQLKIALSHFKIEPFMREYTRVSVDRFQDLAHHQPALERLFNKG